MSNTPNLSRIVSKRRRFDSPEVRSWINASQGRYRSIRLPLQSTRLAGSRFACGIVRPVLPEVDSLAGYEGGQTKCRRFDSIRLESIGLPLQSTRLAGSRFACGLWRRAENVDDSTRFDSNRSIRFPLQSTRLTGSRFACGLWGRVENVDDSTRIDRFVCLCSRPVLPEVDLLASYEEGQKMLTIRLDSTRIDRFVCPCSRPVLPEVDSLAGYEGGQKMSTIRLDSTRIARNDRFVFPCSRPALPGR